MKNRKPTEEPPEVITDPGRIYKIIHHAYQQRALLTALFPEQAYKGNCIIVGVNRGDKELLINKLSPELAHTRFIKERSIVFISLLDGVEIAFRAKLKSLINENRDSYYLVKLPERLSYHQKRGAYRADVKYHDPIPVSISLDDGSQLNGLIDDISNGGLSISFERHIPLSLQIDNTLASCSFTIPEKQNIACELNIRFIQHIHEKTAPRIGAKFRKLSKEDHQKIMQFVMRLERLKRRQLFQ